MDKSLDEESLAKAIRELCRTMRMRRTPVDSAVAASFEDPYARIARDAVAQVRSAGGDPNFVTRAVRYITLVHAMPPLEGNIAWFDGALSALVEIAFPNTVLETEMNGFLEELYEGLQAARGSRR